jgi:AGZA family xanthine/uracil permease-like MFS transporter
MLDRFFRLKANGTTVRREMGAGLTTFVTMSYIVFVQPVVLGAAGMDAGAVMTATCLASAFATLLMGCLANYPIALAPGMGHNFFFTYTVVLALGYTWQQALGAVFLSGSLFVLLAFVGFRERLLDAVPAALRHGIAAGIGLLIALVGFEWGGIVVGSPATLVQLGSLTAPPTLLTLLGLSVTAVLLVWRLRAAILLGILATLGAGLATGLVQFEGMVGRPPSLAATFLELDIAGALRTGMLSVIFVFFFLDLFDTVGTLIGVGQEAGLVREDGTLPRAPHALLADALGTVSGALLGTSTVTSYVESAAGVSAGGRTGLAACVTAVLLLLAIFCSPLVGMIGRGVPAADGRTLYPLVAPALILVGSLMVRSAARIDWSDPTEAIPGFLTILVMPLTFSITEGIAFGFIAYTLLKAVTGRLRRVPLLIAVFAVLFVARYVFLR